MPILQKPCSALLVQVDKLILSFCFPAFLPPQSPPQSHSQLCHPPSNCSSHVHPSPRHTSGMHNLLGIRPQLSFASYVPPIHPPLRSTLRSLLNLLLLLYWFNTYCELDGRNGPDNALRVGDGPSFVLSVRACVILGARRGGSRQRGRKFKADGRKTAK